MNNSGFEIDSTDQSSVAGSSKSRHSSIGGPYRNGWVDKSFPYCNPVQTPDIPDSFSRPLLSSGHGFPLWTPSGASIGDVGVLDLDGKFTFFFNIFLPSDDPVQTDYTPSNFVPIRPPLSADEIRRNSHQFAPGTVIASPGIETTQLSSSPLNVKFTSTAREGGIIVLPQGGQREDLISTSRLYSYVRQNALGWYRHIRDYIEESIPNGSLYIVTGCDKVSSCAVASFPGRRDQVGGKVKLRYTDQDKRPWSSTEMARTNFYRAPTGFSRLISTIFIRGMRISLSSISWIRDLEYHVPTRCRPYYDVLSTPVVGFRSKYLKLREQLTGPSEKPSIEGVQELFHPSDLISQMLLEKSQSARVALVEDSVWLPLIYGHTNLTLPEVINLVMRVFQTHKPFTKHGLTMLVPKSKDEILEEEPRPKLKFCLPGHSPPCPSEDQRHVERIITLRH